MAVGVGAVLLAALGATAGGALLGSVTPGLTGVDRRAAASGSPDRPTPLPGTSHRGWRAGGGTATLDGIREAR